MSNRLLPEAAAGAAISHWDAYLQPEVTGAISWEGCSRSPPSSAAEMRTSELSPRRLLRPGMRLLVHINELGEIHVGIALSGAQARVAEQFLNRAQIRAALQQVRGE